MDNGFADYRVLLVDDDPAVHDTLKGTFAAANLHMVSAFDGAQALEMLKNAQPDIVVTDIVMPKVDGYELCRSIREQSDLPIIILSAKGDELDRLLGLELGADDYIVKPYSAKEVAARIRTVLRRLSPRKEEAPTAVTIGNLELNIKAYQVKLNGVSIPCTSKEIAILWTLATHQGIVFTREHLLQSIWGYDYLGDTRAVDSHIKRIRAKLTSPENNWDIRTVWGVGYRFELL